MKTLVVLALLPLALASPMCVLGPWGPWQATTRPAQTQAVSYPVEVTSAPDVGRQRWEESMKIKEYMFKQAPVVSASSLNLKGQHQCITGMAGNIPCSNVDQLAFMDFMDLGYDSAIKPDNDLRGSDIWGWTDPVTGDEYVIEQLSSGTSFVRITDPLNPFTVGFMYAHTDPSIWRDVKTVGHWAFVGSEASNHGMQIFDLTRLRGVNNFMPNMEPDAHYNKVGQSHNIVANDETGYIYIVGATKTGGGAYTPCKGGLHVVDVRDPKNPKFAGCFDEDGYTHDAQCVIYTGPDAKYYKREICFAFNEDTLTIVDVSDKTKMKAISKIGYNGYAYSHQGWVTEDMTVLLLDDELDEMTATEGDQYTRTLIWDIRDLDKPVLKRKHVHENLCIDHNQYIKDGFTYQANYESGLRILAINQKDFTLKEVGYFDVFPERTTANFGGTWSVYPYFKSGVVAISSTEYGLFIVKPDNRGMEMTAKSVSAQSSSSMQVRYREVLFQEEGSICQALAEGRVV